MEAEGPGILTEAQRREIKSKELKLATNEDLIRGTKYWKLASKWFLALSAGLIVMDNTGLFAFMPDTRRAVLFICLASIFMNVFAMLRFEEIYFALERETADTTTKDAVLDEMPALKWLTFYAESRFWTIAAIILGIIAAVVLIVSMFCMHFKDQGHITYTL
jgi:hypothetical protein